MCTYIHANPVNRKLAIRQLPRHWQWRHKWTRQGCDEDKCGLPRLTKGLVGHINIERRHMLLCMWYVHVYTYICMYTRTTFVCTTHGDVWMYKIGQIMIEDFFFGPILGPLISIFDPWCKRVCATCLHDIHIGMYACLYFSSYLYIICTFDVFLLHLIN